MKASKTIKARLAKLEAKSEARSCKMPLVQFAGEATQSDVLDRPILNVTFVAAPIMPTPPAGGVKRG